MLLTPAEVSQISPADEQHDGGCTRGTGLADDKHDMLLYIHVIRIYTHGVSTNQLTAVQHEQLCWQPIDNVHVTMYMCLHLIH